MSKSGSKRSSKENNSDSDDDFERAFKEKQKKAKKENDDSGELKKTTRSSNKETSEERQLRIAIERSLVETKGDSKNISNSSTEKEKPKKAAESVKTANKDKKSESKAVAEEIIIEEQDDDFPLQMKPSKEKKNRIVSTDSETHIKSAAVAEVVPEADKLAPKPVKQQAIISEENPAESTVTEPGKSVEKETSQTDQDNAEPIKVNKDKKTRVFVSDDEDETPRKATETVASKTGNKKLAKKKKSETESESEDDESEEEDDFKKSKSTKKQPPAKKSAAKTSATASKEKKPLPKVKENQENVANQQSVLKSSAKTADLVEPAKLNKTLPPSTSSKERTILTDLNKSASGFPLGRIEIKTPTSVRVGLSRNTKVKPLHQNVKPIN